MIPCWSDIWLELEKRFKDAFSNYAECKRAQDEMKKLKMKNNNLNEYLAAFKTLGQCTELDLNNPSNLWTFALGLPWLLANACIRMENPETYEQWRATVQRQQKIYLGTKALHSEYGTPSGNRTQGQGQRQTSGWVWQRPGGNHSSSNNQNWHGQGNHTQPPWPCLPPQDDNTMDTSAVIQKATNNKEHKKYHKTGQYFKCGKQGHLVHDCPNKKACACTTCMVQIEDDNKLVVSDSPSATTSLAAWVACLSKEDQWLYYNLHS